MKATHTVIKKSLEENFLQSFLREIIFIIFARCALSMRRVRRHVHILERERESNKLLEITKLFALKIVKWLLQIAAEQIVAEQIVSLREAICKTLRVVSFLSFNIYLNSEL
jgi:hypothetical protein